MRPMFPLVLCATGLLSACATTAPTPPPQAAACNAQGAHWAVGHAPDAATVDRIVSDTGSRSSRVLAPTSPATADYRPDRVSIMVNERGAITGIKCG
ncbi:hypothetical protein H4F99_14155 [Lysobacter sp. SG-8]|uniref:Peptidase inhibitor I78 family protein n=1 Tax=Marilutibacter penaei TaxID=2759900 RepID=A0A7W3YF91_9GAMM|nr:I78 family peptidase inhibitor [Lysobacter penaei]MBB1089624.1 hypothetical protein [Lysobacter penaei]